MDASIDRIVWFCPKTLSTEGDAPRPMPHANAATPTAENTAAWVRYTDRRPGHKRASALHARRGAASGGTTTQRAPAIDTNSIPAISVPASKRQPSGAGATVGTTVGAGE